MNTNLKLGVALIAMTTLPIIGQAQSVTNQNAAGVYRVTKDAPKYVEGEVIVKLKDASTVTVQRRTTAKRVSANEFAMDAVFQELNIQEMQQLMPLSSKTSTKTLHKVASNGAVIAEKDLSQVYVAKFDTQSHSVEEAVEALTQLDNVEYAEPNYIVYMSATQEEPATSYTDPLVSQQWGIAATNLSKLWAAQNKETRRPVIAIMDTGVDIDHPDLKDNIWTNAKESEGLDGDDDDDNGYVDDLHGWNFVDFESADLTDNCGHGTHCAGLAAAVGNNGIGIVGANPDAYIMAVKVLDDRGQGNVATIVRGVDYAVANGADILNMSFGFIAEQDPSLALTDAINKAYQQGVLSVAAAGNDGLICEGGDFSIHGYNYERVWPAHLSLVIGVMSASETGTRSSFSNYGNHYDVTIPGYKMYSTFPGGQYKYLSGTSMATAFMSGILSRVLQNKGYDYASDNALLDDVKNAIMSNSTVLDAYKLSQYTEETREFSFSVAGDYVAVDENKDGSIDAGETVEIYPQVTKNRGMLSGVTFTLEAIKPTEKDESGMMEGDLWETESATIMSPEYYDITPSSVDFGWSLNSSYSVVTGKTPFVVHLHADAPHGQYVTLALKAKCNGIEDSNTVSFAIDNVTELTGRISRDTILPGKEIVVNGNLIIDDGVTVTLSEGTVLSFEDFSQGQQPTWYNHGTIIAVKGSVIEFSERHSFNNYYEDDGIGKIIIQSGAKGVNCPGVLLPGSIYEGVASFSEIVGTPDEPITIIGDVDNYVHSNDRHYEYVRVTGTMEANYHLSNIKHCTVSTLNINTPEYYQIRKINGEIEPFEASPVVVDDSMVIFDKLQIAGEAERVTTISNGNIDYDYAYPQNGSIILKNRKNLQVEFQMKVDPPMDNNFNHYIQSGYAVVFDSCTFSALSLGSGYYQSAPILFNYCNVDIDNLYKTSNKVTTNFEFDNCNVFFSALKYGYPYNSYMNEYYYNYDEGFYYKSNLTKNEIVSKNIGSNIISSKYSFTNHYFNYGPFDSIPSQRLVESYFGTSSLDYINKYCIGQNPWWPDLKFTGFAPGARRPSLTAPSMVETIKVDGYDTHDDYFDMPSLGVGDHTIAVHFTKPMDVNVAPTIMMGRIYPFTQKNLGENGSWNSDSTVYTATFTITSKYDSDGINYIVVSDAVDATGMEILKELYPDGRYDSERYAYQRFKVNIQVAGALSTDLVANAGIGKVELTWNTDEADFVDLMGYNIYRIEKGTTDTIKVNTSLIEANTISYIDYDVLPDTTYYYLVREIGTDFKEFDVSNMAFATPLNAGRGDSNGSAIVDVADVVTDVSYILDQDPKPFLFNAADVNADSRISILDVVGTVNIIFGKDTNGATVASVATYTIENGVLWVDCSESLGGVQIKLNGTQGISEFTPLEGLNGLEQSSVWQTEREWLFIAYSMSGNAIPAGRHAIMRIGDASLSELVLSNTQGRNIMALSEETTSVASLTNGMNGRIAVHTYDMTGREVSLGGLSKGIYVVCVSENGKEVKTYRFIKQ